MARTCPQCGATFSSGEACIDRFNAAQIQEVENPTSYYAVHHLSVPSYMLQHNAYSRRGWLATRQLLNQFVYEGLTPMQARRRNRRTLDSGKRTWSLTKGDKLAQVDDIIWSRTIAEVRTDTPEHYRADVRDWAIAVLADTAPLVQELGGGN